MTNQKQIMKKLAALLVVLNLYYSASAQKDDDNIRASVIGFFNGMSLLNSDTLKYYATEDFLLLEDGMVWNMDSLVTNIMPAKKMDFKRVNKFDFLTVSVDGKNAWAGYFNTADFTVNGRSGTVKWLESVVLIKVKDMWKIRMMHSTRMRPPQKG